MYMSTYIYIYIYIYLKFFRYLHNFLMANNKNCQQGWKLKLSNKIYKLPKQ